MGIFVHQISFALACTMKNFSNTKLKQFMTTTEQIKGIVERLGALRRYL